jgi:hypothetical protein
VRRETMSEDKAFNELSNRVGVMGQSLIKDRIKLAMECARLSPSEDANLFVHILVRDLHDYGITFRWTDEEIEKIKASV